MTEVIQRSFTSGEISPSLQSRADTVKYATGLNLCENFFIKPQGGAYSRPGFRYVGPLDDMTKKGILKKFIFNTEQTYMLVFEHLKLRVIKDGGFVLKQSTITNVSQANPAVVTAVNTFANGEQVTISNVVGMTELNGNTYTVANVTANDFELSGVDSTAFTAYTSDGDVVSDAIFELVTPYTEAQLPDLGFTQSADVMTIVHHDHDPANLNRLADDNWTLVDVDYTPVIDAPVISSVAVVGSGAGTYSKQYEYVVTAVDANGVESLASVSSSISTPSLSVTAGLRITWAAVTGAEYYRVYKDSSVNTDLYGWIGDSYTLTFDDYNIAPVSSDAPPEDRTPFDGANNKPSAVNYYQQRQIFANTLNEPQVTYTTQTGTYNSLRTSNPARAKDAITFTIAGQQVNEIRHIVAINSLILLTSGAEWKVTEGQDQVLAPDTVGIKPQSYNGASKIPPVIVNSTVVYIQEKGARVRDLAYEFVNDNYTGNDLSLMSEHLFEGHELVSMAYAAEPNSIIYFTRDDGVMLGFTYQKEHKVWGWHQHTTPAAGEFEWIDTTPEDNRDALYAIVKRTIDGQTKRYIERLEPREQVISEDCFYVDSGLSYDGVAISAVSNLDHLEGEEVIVLADGNVVEGLVVTGGSITLPREASKIHVGLLYIPAIETLDIDTPSSQDTLKSKSLSVSKVYLEVEKSRGGWVVPRVDVESGYQATEYEIKPRFDSDGYDSIQLKTFKQSLPIDPLWSKGGGIRVEQRSPLPLSILSIIPDIDAGGN